MTGAFAAARDACGLGPKPKRSPAKSTAARNKARREDNAVAQPGSFSPPDPYRMLAASGTLRMAGPASVPAFQMLGEAWASTSGPLHLRQLLPPLDAVVSGQPASRCYMWLDGCRPQAQVEHILRAVANCLHDRALQRWDPASQSLVPFDPLLALHYPLGGNQCMFLSADKIFRTTLIHQPEKAGYAVINLALTEELSPAEMGEASRRTRSGDHHYYTDDGGTTTTLKVIGVHRFVCWAFNGMPPLPSAEEMAAWGEEPRDREAGWFRFMQEVQCMHLCNNHPPQAHGIWLYGGQ